ncbi:MAG: MaoC family dehydratase [Acidimicrobiia bacterium]
MTEPDDLVVTPKLGRWFEELPVGLTVRHGITRTITESDNVLFTCLSMNPQPLHLDHEFAKGTEWGKPLVNSLFTLALVVGLTVADLTLGTTIGNLGFEEVKFPNPVFSGDTIRAESTVVAARASASRPTQGIVTFEHRGLNQRGEIVVTAVRNGLVRKRPVE